jgi:hypothetical protein
MKKIMNTKCNYLSAQHSHDKVCFNFVFVYREHKQRGTNTMKLEKVEILKNGKGGGDVKATKMNQLDKETKLEKRATKKNLL